MEDEIKRKPIGDPVKHNNNNRRDGKQSILPKVHAIKETNNDRKQNRTCTENRKKTKRSDEKQIWNR